MEPADHPPLAPPPPPDAEVSPPDPRARRLRVIAVGVAVALAAGAVGAFALRDGSERPVDEAMPASADLALVVSLRPSAQQTMHLTSLASRFPLDGGLDGRFDEALGDALAEADLRIDDLAWVGAQVGMFVDMDVAGLAAGSSDAADAAVVVASVDDAAARDALDRARRSTGGSWRRSDREGVSLWVGPDGEAYTVSGGFAVAGTRGAVTAAVDTIAGRAASLASDMRYAETIGELPPDRLATGYLDAGRLFSDLAAELGGAEGTPSAQELVPELDAYLGVAGSLAAEADGLALDGVVTYAPERLPEAVRERLAATPAGDHELFRAAPADAYAAFAQRGYASALDDLLGQLEATRPGSADELERLGLVGEGGLLSFLTGDAAFEIGPGAPVAGSLLLATSDAEGFVGSVRTLIRRLDLAPTQGLARSDHRGVTVWTVPGSPGFDPSFAATGSVAIVTSSPERAAAALDALADGSSIAERDAFVRGTSHVPTEDAVGFVDVGAILAAVREALPASELEAFERDVAPFLDPISSISMGSESTPEIERVRVFVEIPASE